MKVLRNANQRNVRIDESFYSKSELIQMEASGIIDGKTLKDNYILYLNRVDELKVIYEKEFGFYCTVAILKDGRKIYVQI